MLAKFSNGMRLLQAVLAGFLILAGCAGSKAASAADYSTGVVTKGTFLLSMAPNVKREGKEVHGLVGYLPVGTRLFYADEPVVLNNQRKGPETYYPVISSLGISGLMLSERFIPVEDHPIGIVVSSFEIVLHNPDPAKGKFKELLTIGRYGGNYLEITGESGDDFYDAVLYRPAKTSGLPSSEKVRLWKELIRTDAVVIVEHETVAASALPVARWSEQSSVASAYIEDLVAKVQDKLGDEVDKIRQFLGDANNIQCLLKGSAEAKVGFSVLGNGLSLKFDLALKEQDHMFRLKQQDLLLEGKKRTYLLLQNIKCDGLVPERLQQFTVQEGIYDPGRRDFVRLKDWSEDKSQWIVSLSGREAPYRMIRIENELGYLTALRRLDSFVTKGDSFINELPPLEKEILLNLILREIAYFEHRDIILMPDPNAPGS